MKTNKEKASYCIGLETGKNLINQFKELDSQLLLDGFHDAIKEKTPKLDMPEIESILGQLQKQITEQRKEYIHKLSEENKKTGEVFLEENSKKEEIKTLASGLQYEVIESGDEENKTPTLMDMVTIHYRATFLDGTVFDSSHEKENPQQFPMNNIIAGWSEALKLMRIGDKWKIFVPHYLAYGEAGFSNAIGPNMTLVFELELIKIN